MIKNTLHVAAQKFVADYLIQPSVTKEDFLLKLKEHVDLFDDDEDKTSFIKYILELGRQAIEDNNASIVNDGYFKLNKNLDL